MPTRTHKRRRPKGALALASLIGLMVAGGAMMLAARARDNARAEHLKAVSQRYEVERDAAIESERQAKTIALQADKTVVGTLRLETNMNRSARLAALGSSVTKGDGATKQQNAWLPRLAEYLRSQPDLMALEYSNYGFSGYTITKLLAEGKLDALIKEKPKVILVDTCLLNDHPQNIPITTTLASLDKLMEMLQQSLPESRVILLLPNPAAIVSANAHGLTYQDYLAKTKNHILSKGWEVVDVHQDMERQRKAANLSLDQILTDGIHPNDTGYGYWYETLRKYFTEGRV